jgi:2-C-methyl-D-erythritol 2,4-cyclodiphosphate synthase/2-C-methyl-D-erythritol 4-phosphate cytidylyltransferase
LITDPFSMEDPAFMDPASMEVPASMSAAVPVCAALITAAGKSTRMGADVKKEYLLLGGKPLILHALEAFENSGIIGVYVITVPPGGGDVARDVLASWLGGAGRAEKTLFVDGGDSRQESVYNGLCALRDFRPDIVLIHDGARPWVRPGLILEVARAARLYGACLPLTPVVDALKEVNTDGFLEAHPDRGRFRGAQTPQGFLFEKILDAHGKAAGDGRAYLDDTEIYGAYMGRVFSVPGDLRNRKVTYPSDLDEHRPPDEAPGAGPRIGFGWDLHRLVPERKLLLGGVEIPSPKGGEGHSDADVLIHAIIDALFGAAGLGDIGSHFPPSDPAYKNISSRVLLRRAVALLRAENLRIVNLDCTVVLESPKILPYRQAIAACLAEDLGVSPPLISVKGKTKEKVDAVGEGRAVEAFAVALLV